MDTVSRVFFQKEFFISGFFPGGDVVAVNLFLRVHSYICTLKILSHCTTTCNIEHVVSHVLLTCTFDCLLHDSTGIIAKLCCFLIYSQFS